MKAAKKTMGVETITPHKAQAYLDASTHKNRTISESRVLSLAIDMEEGRFLLNGETIIFDDDCNVIDGSHRLNAVVLSRATIKSYVVRGAIHADSFETIDSGGMRNGGDVLGISGIVNAQVVSTACNWLFRLKTNNLMSRKSLNNSQFVKFHNENPGLTESVRMATRTKKLCSVGIMGALHYLFAKKNAALADAFVDQLATGAELSDTDPIYHLRETFIRDAAKRHERMGAMYRMAVTIKAWNALRNEQEVKALRWATAEKFPKIQ